MKNLIIILLLAFSVICSCEAENQQFFFNEKNDAKSNISDYKLPKSLEWCGEQVPLDIEEVRERAEREFYLLLQQPGQMVLYLKRAGRFFPVFERVIKEHKMPDDLKYLSVAESALFMSRSAKDAVGLWQFIPSTGKAMGLIIDDYVDERRHIEKSTNAALRYLKQGFNSYKSWYMAAAGYNMGYTNLDNNVKFQSTENYFDLFLNEETSRYILRIVIIKELMKNAAKYGFNLGDNEIYIPNKTKKVKITTKITNLAEWAKEQGTTYKHVKLYNPWILKRELPAPPKGYWEIEIPVE